MSSGPATFELELCIDSVASARVAEAVGCARVELCSGLSEGGLTPSYGLVVAVRRVLKRTKLYVLVRPRSGDFVYTPDEITVACKDARQAVALGADGIVFGALTPDGNVDFEALESMAEAALPAPITFHRAIDMAADPVASVAALAARAPVSVERVLTSGGAHTASEGAPVIARMVTAAGARLQIMAGGGITPDNAEAIVRSTGVRQVHASARTKLPSVMRHRNLRCFMGSERLNTDDVEYVLHVADEERARSIIRAAARGYERAQETQIASRSHVQV